MNSFFQKILVIASLALFAGCDTENPSNEFDSSAQADGGSNDGGGKPDANSNPDYWDWKDVPVIDDYGHTLIEGKVPDDKPATFYVCSSCPSWKGGQSPDYEKDPCVNMREPNETHVHDTVVFKDVLSFKYPTIAHIKFGSDFKVCVERKNHLFVPQFFHIEGAADPKMSTSKKLEWKNAGSWGLAPNGTYVDSDGGGKTQVKTTVVNNKVIIDLGIPTKTTVDNTNLSGEDTYAKVNGNISTDLSKITYDVLIKNTGKQFTGFYSSLK